MYFSDHHVAANTKKSQEKYSIKTQSEINQLPNEKLMLISDSLFLINCLSPEILTGGVSVSRVGSWDGTAG